jgi:cytochrome c5/glucose/arabinose dehydrogenase
MTFRTIRSMCICLTIFVSACGGSSSSPTLDETNEPLTQQTSITQIGEQSFSVDTDVSITPVLINSSAGAATFSIQPQPLPGGLLFDAISGQLSGRPVDSGSTSISISLLIDGVSVDATTFQLNIIANPTTIASAQFPLLADDDTVSWTFAPQSSRLQMHLAPFLEMPMASNGLPARWNDLITLGDRIFVLQEHDGLVYEITNGQALLWFDVGTAIQTTTGRNLDIGNAWQSGLRSLAFHPDFQSNGKFYTTVMEQRPANPAEHHYLSDAAGIDVDGVLIEWTANSTTLEVDSSSYREVLRIGIPQYDHPIKQIEFDPYAQPNDDNYGLLYLAHGDGGADFSITNGGLGNNALGKILRINPLRTTAANYSIPADNPFINDPSMFDEVYSLGHRNPHHLAFTRDRRLLVTEAGGENIDEVNLIEKGGNYGWSEREGSFVYRSDTSTLYDGIAPLPANDAELGFQYPVAQYGHVGTRGRFFLRVALAGGFVIDNGSPIDGEYFYTEFATTGELFHSSYTELKAAVTQGPPETLTMAQTYKATLHFDHDNNTNTEPQQFPSLAEIITRADGYVGTDRLDIRFGLGPLGELYIMSKRNNMIYLVTSSLPGGQGGFVTEPGPNASPPPVATNDQFAVVNTAMTLTLDVLANDSDSQQLPLQIRLESNETTLGGQLTLDVSNLSYTPPPNMSSSDTFTYQVINSNNITSNIATVLLTPPVTAPVSDGQALYQSACENCHSRSFPNAPQLGESAFWMQRLSSASSIEELVDSVVNGLNTMPAFGTSTYTRTELREAVEYLSDQAPP